MLAPATGLCLPSLAQIPGDLQYYTGERADAGLSIFAEAMAREGILTEHHFQPDAKRPLTLDLHCAVEAAFRDLVQSYAKLWKVWPANMQLSVMPNFKLTAMTWRDDRPNPGDGAIIGFTDREHIRVFHIGKELEHLEKKFPGTGPTICALLNRGCWDSFGCFGPEESFGAAVHMKWAHSDDETEILRQMRTEGEWFADEDEYQLAVKMTDAQLTERYELFTRKQFESVYPGGWAWKHAPTQPHRISPRYLQKARRPERRILHLANLLHDNLAPRFKAKRNLKSWGWQDYEPSRNQIHDLEGCGAWAAPVVIEWVAGDHTGMLFDECVNEEYQGDGHVDEHFALRLDVTDVTACRATLRELLAVLHTATLTDALLDAIACPRGE